MLNKTLHNEKGFVLVTSLMMLVVLMIIGIAATNTTTVELQISGNDKAAKQTFYQADGGADVGVSILEENIIESGFDSTGGYHGVDLTNTTLYMNSAFSGVDASMIRSGETTEFRFLGGATQSTPGSGAQMAAGYEGKGKSAASGGSFKVYDVQSRHFGPNNSEAAVRVQWRRML